MQGDPLKRFSQPGLLITNLFAGLVSLTSISASAGPEGAEVVGGAGSISREGATTTINQTTDRMAIDWQSYNVNANERVHYIQPDSSSVSLNRILSNSASHIHGRIDANGQVFLVNPNGVFFGKDSVINVGGILASGLSIDPTDFMNGDFVFSAMEGTDGLVINGGLLNAATGGSVSLLGQQIQNDGVISAQLGSVNLAAGREAILTFDEGGLLGVQITESMLQDEVGVDTAIINNGEITAEDGQILISASASQNVFTQAVNAGELKQARSVVFDEDGSFTLSAGANVVNTGSISASGETGGDIVVLGENVTSSGNISADSNHSEHAGAIEIHSVDTTLIAEEGSVSAVAENGVGGDVKILGDKVGLSDTASINASGESGGGQVLFGGDETGSNHLIRNAQFIFLGENTSIYADALVYGNGGRLITFAENTARIYGHLYARGGEFGGDGGFIETSGLRGFDLSGAPDVSGVSGEGGVWLIDPYNITISTADSEFVSGTLNFTPDDSGANIDEFDLRVALTNGVTVIVSTTNGGGGENGNITLDTSFDETFGNGTNTLVLNAEGDIDLQSYSLGSSDDPLNIILNANFNDTTGNVLIDGGTLNTAGGYLAINATNVGGVDDAPGVKDGELTSGFTGSVFTSGGDFYVGVSDNANGTIDFAAGTFEDPIAGDFWSAGTIDVSEDDGGGDIDINVSTSSGDVTLGNINMGNSTDGGALTSALTVDANNITLSGAFNFGADDDTQDHTVSATLNADGNVVFDDLTTDNTSGGNDVLNLTLSADHDDSGSGDVTLQGTTNIWLGGGDFVANGHDVNIGRNLPNVTNSVVPVAGQDDVMVDTEGGHFVVGGSLAGDVVTASQISGDFNLGFQDFLEEGNGSDTDSASEIETAGGNTYINAVGAVLVHDSITTSGGDITVGELATPVGGFSSGFDAVPVIDNNPDNDVTFTSDFGSIDTTGGASDDDGAVSITSTGNVALGDVATNAQSGCGAGADNCGDLSIETDGTISDIAGAALSINGTSLFQSLTGALAVELDTGSHSFSGDISVGSNVAALTLGHLNISTGGTAVSVNASGAITQPTGTDTVTLNGSDLTVNAGSVQINDVTTSGGNDENSGSISITSSVGTIDAGNLNAIGGAATTPSGGGNANNGRDGLNGGVISVIGEGAVDITSLNASGSDSFDGHNDGSNEFTGGAAGSITITSNTSNIDLGDVVTDGGHGFALVGGGSAGNDDANGGDANNIVITANSGAGSVSLSGNIHARGGHLFDGSVVAADVSNGLGGSITVDGNVVLESAIEIDSDLAPNDLTSPGTGDSTPADITITGTINGTTALTETLTINGANFDFDGNIGETTSLGAITIDATGAINSDDENLTIRAASFALNSGTSFYSSDINTAGAGDAAGGNITINVGTGDITAGELIASGGTSTANGGYAGGAIDLDGNDISVGAINTSGSDAFDNDGNGGDGGAVSITSVDDSGSQSITISGDVNTSGGALNGSGADGSSETTALVLSDAGGAPGGSISLPSLADFITSDISITGSSGTDTLNGPSITNTASLWTVTGANAGTISDAGATFTVTFTDIETLQGGTEEDQFSLSTTDFDGSILGGAGTDTVIGAAQDTEWNITAANAFSITGVTDTSFDEMENLEGNAGDHVDTFNLLAGTVWAGGVDGAGGASDVVVAGNQTTAWSVTAANNTGTVTGLTTTFTNVEVLRGDDDAATVDTFDINSGESFAGSIEGRDGDDIFNIDEDVTVAISGGDGDDTFNLTANSITASAEGDDGADDFVIGDAVVVATVDGGNDTDTLTAFDSASTTTWTINGATDGYVVDSTDIDFSQVDTLQGGTGIDNFTVTSVFTGTINGGAGVDTFDIDAAITGALNGELGNDIFQLDANVSDGSGATRDVLGGVGDDTFNVAGGITVSINGDDEDTADGDTIVLTDTTGNHSWVLSDANSGVLNSTIDFTGLESIDGADGTGNDGNDEFEFGFSGFFGGVDGNADARGGTDDSILITDNSSATEVTLGASLAGVANAETIASDNSGDYTLQLSSEPGAAGETNTWSITGVNDGSIDNGTDPVINFTDFANVLGNEANDVFVVSGGGSIESVNGIRSDGTLGGSESNSLTYFDGGNLDADWELTGANAGTINTTDLVFSNIQTITGSGNDNLTARNSQTNIWELDAADGGTVEDSGANDTIAFSGFNNLTGGDEIDTFNVNNGVDFSGALVGADGNDVFNLVDDVLGGVSGGNDADDFYITNTTLSSTVNGNAGDDALYVLGNNIDVTFNGGSNDDTVIGYDDGVNNNNWDVNNNQLTNDANPGSIIDFSNVEILTGGSGVDIFTLSANVTRTLNGSGGVDEIIAPNLTNDWVLTSDNTGTLNTVVSFSGIDTLTGGSGTDELTGINQNNNWQITGTNSGTVDDADDSSGDVTFTDIEDLVGGTGDDTFTLGGAGAIDSIDGAESTDDDDTLVARDVANTWNLTNANLGNLQTTAGPTTYVSSFTNIETLDGSETAADNFNFSVFADYNILAGTSAGDAANYSTVTADVAITVGAGVIAGLDDIEEVVGNNDGLTNTTYSSALTLSTSNTATWTISDANGGDGVNDGSISFGGNTIIFTNFSDLVGGSGNDTFNLNPASGSSGVSGSIDGGVGTLDTITARDVATVWNIFEDNSGGSGNEFAYGDFTYQNGEVDLDLPPVPYESTTDFEGIEIINGSDQGDIYTIDNFTVGGAFAITLNAGAGTDAITLPNQNLDITLGQAIGGIGLNGFDIISANAARTNILRSTSTSGAAIAWSIDGDNSGSVDGVAFNNFQSLYGGNGNDTFTFDTNGEIDALIDGGAGSNEIAAKNVATRWLISGANTGSIIDITTGTNTYLGSFQNIDTLTGAATSNEFNFDANGYFQGTIVGGAGTDEISVVSMTGQDTLWLVDSSAEEDGSVQRVDTADNSTITSSATYSEIESLEGGSATDKFIFSTAGVFTGNADGAGGTDVVDLSGISGSVSVIATAGDIHGISNTEQLIGNGADTSLTGFDSAANTWTIDSVNEGQLASGSNSVAFFDVYTLIGSDSVADQFNFEVGGVIDGQVQGGAGAFIDVVTGPNDGNTWTLTTPLAGNVNGSDFIEIEEITGGSISDELIGRAQENTWVINATDAGYVEGSDSSDRITFSGIENLSGNSSNDHFEFTSNGVLTGTIDADDGALSPGDTLTVSSASGQSVIWTLNGSESGLITGFLAGGFSDINSVMGGAGQDTVNVTSAFSGGIQTLGNSDTVTLGASVSGTIDSGEGNDRIEISDSASSASLINGGNGTDTLELTHGDASNWSLTSNDGGSVTSFATVNFDGINVIEGNGAVDTLNVSSDFSGNVALLGGNDDVTLNANITGTFETGDGDDLIRIAETGLSTTINAGNNNDTLRITHTSASVWEIDGTNTVDDVSFSNVETLEGNDATDTVTLTDAISRIDTFGGADVLYLGDDVTTLNTGEGNDTVNIDVDGIAVLLDAGSGASDQLNIAHSNTSTWTFDTTDTVDNVTFSGVEVLQGNDAIDTVNVNTAFSGSLSTFGANDDITLSADFANLNLGNGSDVIDITVDNLRADITGGDDAGTDVLTIAHTGESVWNIDTSSTVDLISFSQFETVNGNDQIDTVTVNGSFGTINTNGGADEIDLNADLSQLNTGAGDDVIHINSSTISTMINTGNNTDELIGPARIVGEQNDWNITSNNSGTLNIDVVFSNVENISGNDGDDSFVIDDGASVENVRGIALALGVDTGSDTLNINDTGTTSWTISGDNEGTVTAGADNFYDIENLTGGADTDQFVFDDIDASISGLIDGGEGTTDPATDSVTDTLDLTIFTSGVVVELGDTATATNPEPTVPTNLHVHNVEQITAAPGTNDAGEENNWLAVNYDTDVRWRLTPFNDGYFEQVVQANANPIVAIVNTRIDFSNFGSFRGGDGDEDSDINPGTNITGEYVAGNGLRTLNYSAIDSAELILVDIDDRILSVIGNGNTILRSIAATDDTWTIDGVNEGQYSNGVDITFDFNQVNQLIGGSGNDTFDFTGLGDLIDGSINGGAGINSINAIPAVADLSFGLNELANNVTVSVSYIGGVTSSEDFTETLLASRTGLIDLRNIADVDASSTSINTLYSGETTSYTWSLGQSGADNSLSGDGQTLNFTNIDTVAGGAGDDTFNVFSLGSVDDVYTGGAGDDTVDVTSVNSAISFSLDDEVTTNIDVQLQGIESLQASVNEHRIVGGDAGATWSIDQINGGTVVYSDDAFVGTQSLDFNSVAHIVGGAANDDFIFDTAGIINGTINGGSGTDTLDASTASQALTVQISETDVDGNVIDNGTTIVDLVSFEDITANAVLVNELRSNGLATNTWVINGTDAGALNGMTFDGFANLTGSTSADTFSLDGNDSISGVIDGGLGLSDRIDVTGLIADVVVAVSDSAAVGVITISNMEQVDALGSNNRIIANDEINGWLIDDVDGGEMTGASFENALMYSGFANLQGGVLRDNFVFTGTGQVSGLIDGSDPSVGTATQIDTVDLSALANDINISLNTAVDGDVDLANIEEIIANPLNNNSLYADDINNNWLVDNENAGQLSNSSISFEGFANLFGGSGNDIFTFEALGSVTGAVDGGDQPVGGADQVDMSQLDVVRVVIGDATSGFVNIESYRGNNTDAIITAANSSNIWTLSSGVNSGQIVDQLNETILFEDFNELEGGRLNDDFILNGGSVSGEIRGGLGNDDLIVTVVDGVSGQVSFDGGDGVDTVATSGGGVEYTATYTADMSGAASLEYNFQDTNNLVTYSVDYVDVNSVTDNVVASVLTLNDFASNADTFVLDTAEFTLNSLEQVTYDNKNSLSVLAESGDSILIEGPIVLANTVAFSNGTILANDTDAGIQALQVNFNGNQAVGAVDAPIELNVDSIAVTNTQGDVYLNEANSINITSMSNNSGNINLVAGVDITDGAALAGSSVITYTSLNGSIILDENNSFTNTVNFSALNNIELTNTSTSLLGDITAQNLTIIAGGNVTDRGVINVSGNATFSMNENNLFLNTATNDFANVSVANANNVSLVDVDDISVQGSASGDFTVNAENQISAIASVSAEDIAFNSNFGVVSINGNLNANNSVIISGEGVDVFAEVRVSDTTLGDAVDINAGAGALLLAGGIDTSNSNADAGDVVLSGNSIDQQQGANIVAGDVDLSSLTFITQSSDVLAEGNVTTNANGGDLVMEAGTVTRGFNVALNSTADLTLETVIAETLIINGLNVYQLGNLSSEQDIDLGAGDVFQSSQNTLLSSASGNVTITAASLDVDGSVEALNGGISATSTNDTLVSGSLAANMIDFDSGGAIAMTAGATMSAETEIALSAENDLALSSLQTNSDGSIVLVSNSGGLEDNNGDTVNIVSNALAITTETNIGSTSDGIETQVSQLHVLNNGVDASDSVRLENIGALNVTALRSNTDIIMANQGTLTMENSSEPDYSYSRSDSDARTAGGVINANYNTGTVEIFVTGGDLLAANPPTINRNHPEIVGEFVNVTVDGNFGGTNGRPIVVYARELMSIFEASGGLFPIWGFNEAPNGGLFTESDLADPSAIGNVSDLLIDLEAADEIDPAVFTEVRNYSYDNISIRMPRDQLYEDDEEEEDEFSL